MTITPRLTCMRGYPGSGKSTIARTLPGVVVSRDDLRMALYGKYNVGKDGEEAVTVAEKAMVTALLKDGRDVVVDAMHVNPRYLRHWAKLTHQLGVEFLVHDVRTPVEECIKRDQEFERAEIDGKSVGESVIRAIAKKFPIEKWPNIFPERFIISPVTPNYSLPRAIIVDIDGTLAHMEGRSPYDYTKVSEDSLDETICGLVDAWVYANHYAGDVLIVSGRDHTCRADTITWLKDHEVYFSALFMRDAELTDNHGNKLPDYIVKYNLFNEHIRGKYNIDFVLDDRTQVVEMWRKLGLKCLQVEPGDF